MILNRILIILIAFFICTLPASAERLEVASDAPGWMHLGAGLLLFAHIGGGAIGMISGPVAILSRKGGIVHRSAGKVFLVSMFISYSIGAAVAPFLTTGQRVNFVAGVMALYLLITSWLAATRRDPKIGITEYAGLAFAIAIAAAGFWFMHVGANHPSGTVDGAPPDAFRLFVLVGVIAAAGDLHVIMRRSISGVSRISRHLWRMCMSLFIASASFLYGQEQVLPDWVVGSLLQSIPVFFPLAAILIWMVLVRIRKKEPTFSAP